MASVEEVLLVDVKAVAKGYRVSRLMGSDVVNDRDESIGTFEDLIIGMDENALFAVLQVGGFLGIAGRLIAIPFESLELSYTDGNLKIILPGATRDALKTVPEFEYLISIAFAVAADGQVDRFCAVVTTGERCLGFSQVHARCRAGRRA